LTTFVFVHGAGDVGWYWHLTEAALRARGHDTVAPDLPCDDDTATLDDYAGAVTDAIGGRHDLVIVGQSYGAFTATLVAARCSAQQLVLVAGMVPHPGETPGAWWEHTRYREAIEAQARRDGGATGNDDPLVSFYNGVPRPLAQEALRRGQRGESSAVWGTPWPLETWPNVPTRFVLCQDDRCFPPAFMRRVAQDRLGITPDEVPGCHCVALSHPEALSELLVSPLG
jgi:pimeloyl-ACP methyl ester carboxylesterase